MGLADVKGGSGAWGDPCTNEGEETDEAKKEKDHVRFFLSWFLSCECGKGGLVPVDDGG